MKWSDEVQQCVAELFGPSVFLEMAQRGDTRLPAQVGNVRRLADDVRLDECMRNHDATVSADATDLTRALAVLSGERMQLMLLTSLIKSDKEYVAYLHAQHELVGRGDRSYGSD